MKKLLFLITLLICSYSWADWEVNSNNARGDMYYIDKSTIRRDGNIAKMWSMRNCQGICFTRMNKVFSSDKTYSAYNCKNETSAILALIQYEGVMGTGSTVVAHNYQNDIEWDQVIPGSLMEYEWKVACSGNR